MSIRVRLRLILVVSTFLVLGLLSSTFHLNRASGRTRVRDAPMFRHREIPPALRQEGFTDDLPSTLRKRNLERSSETDGIRDADNLSGTDFEDPGPRLDAALQQPQKPTKCVAGEVWPHLRRELTPPPAMKYTEFSELKGPQDSDGQSNASPFIAQSHALAALSAQQ